MTEEDDTTRVLDGGINGVLGHLAIRRPLQQQMIKGCLFQIHLTLPPAMDNTPDADGNTTWLRTSFSVFALVASLPK
jgi:hypothetical protein